jgi:hypothetical protein
MNLGHEKQLEMAMRTENFAALEIFAFQKDIFWYEEALRSFSRE